MALDNPIQGDVRKLAELLGAEYRLSPLFLDDSAAQMMHLYLAEHALTNLSDGGCFFLRRRDELLGVVALKVHQHPLFGCWVNEIFIAMSPHEKDTGAWLEVVLSQVPVDNSHPVVSRISAYHHHLLPILSKHGLGVDAIGLVSDTEQALRQLVRQYNPPVSFHTYGLAHTLMRTEDLDEVIALRKAAFCRAPQFCWFGAHSGHLDMQRRRLESDLDGEHAWWVLRDGETLIGTFGSAITTGNPMWGPVGGLELIFDPQYHGQGLSKIAYRLTLERLLNHRCLVFKGVTAQPPVIRLSHMMERQLFDIHLRSDAYFQPAHFAPFLS